MVQHTKNSQKGSNKKQFFLNILNLCETIKLFYLFEFLGFYLLFLLKFIITIKFRTKYFQKSILGFIK